MKFDVSGKFYLFYSLLAGELMTIEDLSLSAHSYQLLPIATSYLVDNNRELMFQTYFEVFYSLLEEGSL